MAAKEVGIKRERGGEERRAEKEMKGKNRREGDLCTHRSCQKSVPTLCIFQ